MSLDSIEAEIAALLDHGDTLAKRKRCGRNHCDGSPHLGFPHRHEATFTAEKTPLNEALLFDAGYRERKHLLYLSDRLTAAVKDVEEGRSRKMIVSMPPRMGKSQLTSVYLPLWLLHKHPEWSIGLISHSPSLATAWGRQVRRVVEENSDILGLEIAKDAGAVSNWEVLQGGGLIARSAPGQSITGLGFRVMLVDDPVKDFASAHSATDREALWDWWVANATTRLEPPSLVVVVATRWHEDDLIGRLLSKEYPGDPSEWEVINLPAIADDDDVIGREPGQPLLSPLLEETEEEALARWASVRSDVGRYTWEALYQQKPSPPEGSIFDMDTVRFWTDNPDDISDDGKTVLLPPLSELQVGSWVDSWDFTFKGSDSSDFVVGQRWVRLGPNRFLIAQQRGRWDFNKSIHAMERWAITDDDAVSPYGRHVHRRLVEDAANGPAIIATLESKLSGIKPIQARNSKEARARAITPEIESGHVYLPSPAMPGFAWVQELLSEMREFPNGAHDDQVDAMTQALNELRGSRGVGGISIPNAPVTRAYTGGTTRGVAQTGRSRSTQSARRR
nr:MAG TPA: Terminase large subunit [Caudoviricetes sp.]